MFYPKDFYKEILNKENVFNDYEIGLINNPLKRILTEDEIAKTKENKSKDKNNKNKNKGEITVIEKVNEVIEILNKMDIKDKLRVGVYMSESSYTNLKYNKSHLHSEFDKRLKEIDNEYLTSYVNMRKYPQVLFVMAKIMEMNNAEQNKVAMYLYNCIGN